MFLSELVFIGWGGIRNCCGQKGMINSKCLVCGKVLLVGEICKDCENETLKEVREKASILSTVTTLLFLLLFFVVWWLSYPVLMQIDPVPVENRLLALEISFDIFRSPKLLPLLVTGLVLIFFSILYKMYFEKLVYQGFKKYHI